MLAYSSACLPMLARDGFRLARGKERPVLATNCRPDLNNFNWPSRFTTRFKIFIALAVRLHFVTTEIRAAASTTHTGNKVNAVFISVHRPQTKHGNISSRYFFTADTSERNRTSKSRTTHIPYIMHSVQNVLYKAQVVNGRTFSCFVCCTFKNKAASRHTKKRLTRPRCQTKQPCILLSNPVCLELNKFWTIFQPVAVSR